MRKFITLLLLFHLYTFSTAQNSSKIDSLIVKLSDKIANAQYYVDYRLYPEIAFIRDKYHVPNLLSNDTPFIARLSDPYYKMLYPYRKLLDKNFVMTEDCITDNKDFRIIEAYKLFYYSLYDNINLPADYFRRLETTSKEDDPFMSPYFALNTIYFLKEFHRDLNVAQLAQLKLLEQNLSSLLFKDYVENKEWSFRKILALKVLKINKSDLVNNLDLTALIDYFLKQGQPKSNILDIAPYEIDTKDHFLLTGLGIDKVRQLSVISVLWIILNEKNK